MNRALRQLRRVRISARDETGVRLRGEGDVVVRTGPDGSVLVSETGVWRDRGGPAVHFTNAYRWRFDGGSIRLTHERRGPGRAVALVDLVPVGPSRWASPAPHACGADLYSAVVRVIRNRVILRWRVRGGSKTRFIRVLYE